MKTSIKCALIIGIFAIASGCTATQGYFNSKADKKSERDLYKVLNYVEKQ